jgi:hypothetical protein
MDTAVFDGSAVTHGHEAAGVVVVGRKLYLSETPSIGWEAKTLGAKRRISSAKHHVVFQSKGPRDAPLHQRSGICIRGSELNTAL